MDTQIEELSTAFALQFFRMHRLLDRALGARGVSLARFKFLMFLKREGPARAADMADWLALAPRTVTEGLDGLERDGLIRRDPDPNDRRAKQVSLTPAGAAAVAAIEPVRNAMLERVMGPLTAQDRTELARLLSTIDANIARVEQDAGAQPPPLRRDPARCIP